jgi:hypothetical protein
MTADKFQILGERDVTFDDTGTHPNGRLVRIERVFGEL